MNSIEKEWRKFITECLRNGKWVTKDDGDEILEITNNHTFIPNILNLSFGNGENITLTMFKEMVGKGVFNITDYPLKNEQLLEYMTALDDEKQIKLSNDNSSFVYTYPNRLYHIHQATRYDTIVDENQIDTIINRLKEHKGSNRAVANLYMCALDKDQQHIPCLQLVHCLIRENQLALYVYFRSNDLYTAFPSNMIFLMYLGLKILEELQTEYPTLKFEGIYYSSSSLHIYKGDYEQSKKVIKTLE